MNNSLYLPSVIFNLFIMEKYHSCSKLFYYKTLIFQKVSYYYKNKIYQVVKKLKFSERKNNPLKIKRKMAKNC